MLSSWSPITHPLIPASDLHDFLPRARCAYIRQPMTLPLHRRAQDKLILSCLPQRHVKIAMATKQVPLQKRHLSDIFERPNVLGCEKAFPYSLGWGESPSSRLLKGADARHKVSKGVWSTFLKAPRHSRSMLHFETLICSHNIAGDSELLDVITLHKNTIFELLLSSPAIVCDAAQRRSDLDGTSNNTLLTLSFADCVNSATQPSLKLYIKLSDLPQPSLDKQNSQDNLHTTQYPPRSALTVNHTKVKFPNLALQKSGVAFLFVFVFVEVLWCCSLVALVFQQTPKDPRR